MFNPADHNPDVNPNWRVNMASRRYQCADCGNEIITTTNHTGACYPQCVGKCYQIVENNRGGFRMRKQTKHVYIAEVTQ